MDNNNFGRTFDYLNNIQKHDMEINSQYIDNRDEHDSDEHDSDEYEENYHKKADKYYKLIPKESKLFDEDKDKTKIYDLSLKNIVINFTKYIIEMLDDLVDYVNNYYILKNKNKNMFNEFIEIFIKKDRLIYTGIFFILLSFVFYFMDISS